MSPQMLSFDQAMIQVFGPSWKSTAGAWLTIFIGISGPATTYLAVIQKPWAATAIGAIGCLSLIAKAVVGHLTVDAGAQLAIPAGGTTPVMMPSHEVPDAAGAKVVTPPKN